MGGVFNVSRCSSQAAGSPKPTRKPNEKGGPGSILPYRVKHDRTMSTGRIDADVQLLALGIDVNDRPRRGAAGENGTADLRLDLPLKVSF